MNNLCLNHYILILFISLVFCFFNKKIKENFNMKNNKLGISNHIYEKLDKHAKFISLKSNSHFDKHNLITKEINKLIKPSINNRSLGLHFLIKHGSIHKNNLDNHKKYLQKIYEGNIDFNLVKKKLKPLLLNELNKLNHHDEINANYFKNILKKSLKDIPHKDPVKFNNMINDFVSTFTGITEAHIKKDRLKFLRKLKN